MTTILPEFRPIGGIDNNLDNPALDPTPGSAELQIAPLNYSPGTTNGLIDAPNARTISNVVSGGQSADGENANTDDPTGASAWLYAFGQFVDHDLDLESVGTTDISIPVPNGDPNFPDGTAIPLTRAITGATTNTATNTLAGDLDLSQIYGSDAATAASLRNSDGTLVTSVGDALPIVNGAFVSGDVRVDENPELTVISTMFVREHNYWVGVLAAENPTWTGDQLYNMAKAITTAEYQNIIYTEYLPALLGPNAVDPYTGYDPTVNSQVTQEFSTAAFRVGHSQVSDAQQGIDDNGNVTFMQSLADSFGNTPAQVEANDGINSLLRDLSNDNSQAVDVYAVDGLRNLLADSPDQMDLIAIDIQRERDLGLGTLNQTREALGLTPYTSFDQLTSDQTVAANLQATYGSIDNVDLFIGGLAENHAPGADVGQTFQTIIADQFDALESGDRFFWLNQDFDPATAQMISQTTLADIIERDTVTPAEQPNAFNAEQRHTSDVAATDPTAPQLVIGLDTPAATIAGGPADDTIVAGLGLNQILIGGGGSDVFQYNGGGHTDSISDWNGSDTIQFQPSVTGAALTALLNRTVDVTDLNCGTNITFDSNTITLPGIAASSLTANNFLFPPTGSPSILVNGNSLTIAATNITGGCGVNITNGCDGTT
jgi:peroxidase